MAGILSLGPGHSDLARQILTHQAPQYSFSFSPFLLKNYRHGLSPDRPACKAYLQGHCPLGTACPDKHTSASSTNNYNNLVCKHWLRGLCKKGESCEFLHEYNLRKMPECSFFSRNGFCSNGEECLYLHLDPSSKLPPCPHYEKGFCPLGPTCSQRHVRKTLCELYLCGFCPDGKTCKKAHPRWPTDLPKPTVRIEKDPEEIAEEQRQLIENAEREMAAEREKYATASGGGGEQQGGGGGGGRGRGRWHSGGGGGGGGGGYGGHGHGRGGGGGGRGGQNRRGRGYHG